MKNWKIVVSVRLEYAYTVKHAATTFVKYVYQKIITKEFEV